MSNFFDPPQSEHEKDSSLASCSEKNATNANDSNSGIKSIFNKLRTTGKIKAREVTMEGSISPKNKFDKNKK